MVITVEISEELADRLRPVETHLAQVLELGLREWQARGPGFAGLGGLLEALAALPEPQDVLALRPAPEFQERLEALAEKSREGGLSDEENREWEQYQFIEHLVRLAKARAALKL